QRLGEMPVQEVGLERREVELARGLVDELAPPRVRVVGESGEDPVQGSLDVGLPEAHRATLGPRVGSAASWASLPCRVDGPWSSPLPLRSRTFGSVSRLGRTRSAGEKSSWLVAGFGTATTVIPAALAARTPLRVSSTTKHASGATARRRAAMRDPP